MIENDLLLPCWPRITWFYDENEIDSIFLWLVQIDLFSVWGGWTWLDFIVEMKWTWLLSAWSKLSCFLYAGRISLVFSFNMQIGLNFVWVVYIDLSSVWVRTWLDSSVGWNGFGCCVGCRKCHHLSVVDRHWFGFRVPVENDVMFLASWSKLTGFLSRDFKIDLILEWRSKWKYIGFYVRDWNWLGFDVGIQRDFFFGRGQERLRFCVRAENYLVLIYRSKLTWFLCASRKGLVFSVGIDWLSICAGGRNWLGFRMLAENHLVLIWASNLASFLCGWSKLTWFHCGGSNLSWFGRRDRN